MESKTNFQVPATFKWSSHTLHFCSMKITELKHHPHQFLRDSTLNKITYWEAREMARLVGVLCLIMKNYAWISATMVCTYNPGLDGQLALPNWWGLGSKREPASKDKEGNRGKLLMLASGLQRQPPPKHTWTHIYEKCHKNKNNYICEVIPPINVIDH